MSYYGDAIRSNVSMAAVADRYGLEVNRAGFLSCPFHQERTASLKVYRDGFYCFGCHAHGSVIDFVMQFFGMDYMGAVGKLNDDFSLSLPIGRKPTLRDKYRTAPKPNKRLMEQEKLEKAVSDAETAWITADKKLSSLEPLSDEFAAALMEREKADLQWREREVKLYEFNQRNDSSGDAGAGNLSGSQRHTGAGGTG